MSQGMHVLCRGSFHSSKRLALLGSHRRILRPSMRNGMLCFQTSCCRAAAEDCAAEAIPAPGGLPTYLACLTACCKALDALQQRSRLTPLCWVCQDTFTQQELPERLQPLPEGKLLEMGTAGTDDTQPSTSSPDTTPTDAPVLPKRRSTSERALRARNAAGLQRQASEPLPEQLQNYSGVHMRGHLRACAPRGGR